MTTTTESGARATAQMPLFGKDKLVACNGIVTFLSIGRSDRQCKTARH